MNVLDSHHCPPVFYVYISDDKWQGYEEAKEKIFAPTPQKAATRFIERWEQGQCDYAVGSGSDTRDVAVWPVQALNDLEQLRQDIDNYRERLADPDLDLNAEERSGMEDELEKMVLKLPSLEAKKQVFTVRGESVPHYYADLKVKGLHE